MIPEINRYWYHCDNNHGDKKWHRQFFWMLTDFIKYGCVGDSDDNGNYNNKSYKQRHNYFINFFLSQLTINKIPIRNAGPLICRAQNNVYHSDGFLSMFINKPTIYNIPAKIKIIPPTISCFQDINKTANRINTGILCINNPTTICQKLNSGEITSNENNAKKHINIIDKILGVQYINLFIFFSILSNSIKNHPDWRILSAPH